MFVLPLSFAGLLVETSGAGRTIHHENALAGSTLLGAALFRTQRREGA